MVGGTFGMYSIGPCGRRQARRALTISVHGLHDHRILCVEPVQVTGNYDLPCRFVRDGVDQVSLLAINRNPAI